MGKMTDLGFKDTFFDEPVSSSKNKKTRFPNLRIREKVPPFLMSKDIEDTFKAIVELKVIEKGIESGKNGTDEHIEFDVLKIAIQPNDSLKNKLSKR